MRAVYLDNNATTPVHPEVLAAMSDFDTLIQNTVSHQ